MEDLTQQRVWKDISRAYERVIIRTPFYQSMMDEVVELVGDKKNVLDMGCGPGYLINRLLEDEERFVEGIDASQHMLDIAKEEVILEERLSRAKLQQADAQVYYSINHPDCIVSTNLLFNLPDPQGFLIQCYEMLSHDGKMIVTSPQKGANLSVLVEAAQKYFEESNQLTEDIQYSINVVRSVNERFRGDKKEDEKKFSTFSPEQITDSLSMIGFQVQSCTETYLGQNFLICAQK